MAIMKLANDYPPFKYEFLDLNELMQYFFSCVQRIKKKLNFEL